MIVHPETIICGFRRITMITVFFLAAGTHPLQAQLVEEWVAKYCGPEADNKARAMVIGPSGNIYVTGSSEGGQTGGDIATIAYDPDGHQLWASRYNSPDNLFEQPHAMAMDDRGNIFVTGYSVDVGTLWDFITVAYDPSGNQLWAARYDGPANGYDEARGVETDASGNVYVAGESEGVGSSDDFATVAYSSSGTKLWEARYNGPENGKDKAYALAVNRSSGTIYVAGDSPGNINPYALTTVAYDLNGNQQWVALYTATIYSGAFADVAVDPSGNVYVIGDGYNCAGANWDYLTVAYDPSGVQRWAACYNGTWNWVDTVSELALDSSGNVYVTGEIFTSSDRSSDCGTIAYDPCGDEFWVAVYDGSGSSIDVATDIAVDRSGNVYVTGYSWDTYEGFCFATIKYSVPNEDEDEDEDEEVDGRQERS
jgi:hypothetical protein